MEDLSYDGTLCSGVGVGAFLGEVDSDHDASSESQEACAAMDDALGAIMAGGGVHGWVPLIEVRLMVNCSEQELRESISSRCELQVIVQNDSAVALPLLTLQLCAHRLWLFFA